MAAGLQHAVAVKWKVSVRADPFIPGQQVNFYIENSPPKSWFFLCWSFLGPGPTNINGTNLSLLLSSPIGIATPIRLDSNGVGQLGPMKIPSWVAPGTQGWFQGIHLDVQLGQSLSLSNMLPVTVQ